MLPQVKTFRDQFWFYALPYGLYVGGNALGPWIGPTLAAILGGLATALSLIYYAKQGRYHFGHFPGPTQWLWTLVLGVAAAAVWVLAYRLSAGILSGGPHQIASKSPSFSSGYLIARGIASTLIIPIAEELFLRVFVLEVVQKHLENRKNHGREWTWQSTLEQFPSTTASPPATFSASVIAGLAFAMGHSPVAWPAALLWFGITQILLRLTRNLQCVMAAHILANALITGMVIHWKMTWLW